MGEKPGMQHGSWSLTHFLSLQMFDFLYPLGPPKPPQMPAFNAASFASQLKVRPPLRACVRACSVHPSRLAGRNRLRRPVCSLYVGSLRHAQSCHPKAGYGSSESSTETRERCEGGIS